MYDTIGMHITTNDEKSRLFDTVFVTPNFSVDLNATTGFSEYLWASAGAGIFDPDSISMSVTYFPNY
jgi:hypothetical protein